MRKCRGGESPCERCEEPNTSKTGECTKCRSLVCDVEGCGREFKTTKAIGTKVKDEVTKRVKGVNCYPCNMIARKNKKSLEKGWI